MKNLGVFIGITSEMSVNTVIKYIATFEFEYDSNGYAYYNEILFAILKRRYYDRSMMKTPIKHKLVFSEEIDTYKKLKDMRKNEYQLDMYNHYYEGTKELIYNSQICNAY
mmetsp:Transcript_11244/g.1687  ORF Transcript_11244/g.1687 Transcript_11244/m.1687 type:complete len:110 (-) Transcript_11244:98-427(-)